VLALGAQSLLALLYLGLTDAGTVAATMLAAPFVWVTVTAVAVGHVERPEARRVVRWVGWVVGVAYALGLAWLMSAVSPSMGMATGLNVMLLPPGWGPAVQYSGTVISLTLFPYRAIGVVSLGYLVSLAVRNVVESGASLGVGGIIALGSCAGCALPLVAAVIGVLGGVGLGFGVGGRTYLVGTLAYVLAVAVLGVRS